MAIDIEKAIQKYEEAERKYIEELEQHIDAKLSDRKNLVNLLEGLEVEITLDIKAEQYCRSEVTRQLLEHYIEANPSLNVSLGSVDLNNVTHEALVFELNKNKLKQTDEAVEGEE